MTRKIKEFNINVKALMNVENSKFILKKAQKLHLIKAMTRHLGLPQEAK